MGSRVKIPRRAAAVNAECRSKTTGEILGRGARMRMHEPEDQLTADCACSSADSGVRNRVRSFPYLSRRGVHRDAAALFFIETGESQKEKENDL